MKVVFLGFPYFFLITMIMCKVLHSCPHYTNRYTEKSRYSDGEYFEGHIQIMQGIS